MDNPSPPQIAPDPNLAAEQAQAQDTLVKNLQNEAQLDTANIMARFGTQLALGNTGITAPAPVATAPIRF